MASIIFEKIVLIDSCEYETSNFRFRIDVGMTTYICYQERGVEVSLEYDNNGNLIKDIAIHPNLTKEQVYTKFIDFIDMILNLKF